MFTREWAQGFICISEAKFVDMNERNLRMSEILHVHDVNATSVKTYPMLVVQVWVNRVQSIVSRTTILSMISKLIVTFDSLTDGLSELRRFILQC